MKISPTLERLERIVFDLLGLDDQVVLSPDTRPADVPEWDSLANVSIVFAVEEEFGVEFSAEQLKGFETIGAFAAGIHAAEARRLAA